jgi:hypothetical protein
MIDGGPHPSQNNLQWSIYKHERNGEQTPNPGSYEPSPEKPEHVTTTVSPTRTRTRPRPPKRRDRPAPHRTAADLAFTPGGTTIAVKKFAKLAWPDPKQFAVGDGEFLRFRCFVKFKAA